MNNTLLNSRLAKLGANTSGSYERRLERLHRFEAAANNRYDQAERIKRIVAKKQLEVQERAEAFAVEFLKNLRNAKMETFDFVDIPTHNEVRNMLPSSSSGPVTRSQRMSNDRI